uniref:MAS related GPR family member F n=1 Tax=Panthera tigris altaica TaxID=74533 RepID=A0A8C9KE82_PANTA
EQGHCRTRSHSASARSGNPGLVPSQDARSIRTSPRHLVTSSPATLRATARSGTPRGLSGRGFIVLPSGKVPRAFLTSRDEDTRGPKSVPTGGRSGRLSAVACALLWALSLLVTTVHNYFCVFLGHRASGVACRHMDAFLGILLFLVFCPLMVLPCLVLILHAECRARRRQRSAKLSHVVLATVSVFLVSSIYLGVFWFLFWVFQIPAPFPEYVTDLCICINSSAKPVVYFLAGRDKSQRLGGPLPGGQRALRDGAELGEAGGGTPNTVTMEMQCPSGNAS